MSQTCPYDWTSQIWGRVQVKWSKVCSFDPFPHAGDGKVHVHAHVRQEMHTASGNIDVHFHNCQPGSETTNCACIFSCQLKLVRSFHSANAHCNQYIACWRKRKGSLLKINLGSTSSPVH